MQFLACFPFPFLFVLLDPPKYPRNNESIESGQTRILVEWQFICCLVAGSWHTDTPCWIKVKTMMWRLPSLITHYMRTQKKRYGKIFTSLLSKEHVCEWLWLTDHQSEILLTDQQSGVWLTDHQSRIWLTDNQSGVWLTDYQSGIWLIDYQSGIWLTNHQSGVSLTDNQSGVWLTDNQSGIWLTDNQSGIWLTDNQRGVWLMDHQSGIRLIPY